jgi:hypothetical protein
VARQQGKRSVDEKVLLALACGATVEAAARSAEVCARTVYRRLKDPAFRRRLDEVRADMVQRASGTLTAAGSEAVKTLLALMKDGSPPPVRLGAAKAVLEMGARLREAAELERRLAALEEQLLGQG